MAGGRRLTEQISFLSVYANKLAKKARTLISESVNKRRKLTWRLANGRADTTVPIFIFGSQRSGTTMLGDCLGKSPEIENLGEIGTSAFNNYFLRDDATVISVIDKNPHKFLVLKPLKDSHKVKHLLNMCPMAKGVWAYRHFSDRINSAVRKFGTHPLEVISAFKSNQGRAWQLQGLSSADDQLIRELDLEKLNECDGAALMWYLRNALFFNQELEKCSRVLLWSYDEFVANPEQDLQRLTGFIGARFFPYMTDGIHRRSLGKHPPPKINAKIDRLCSSLYERLEATKKLRSAAD
jgi:hypothetical protein